MSNSEPNQDTGSARPFEGDPSQNTAYPPAPTPVEEETVEEEAAPKAKAAAKAKAAPEESKK